MPGMSDYPRMAPPNNSLALASAVLGIIITAGGVLFAIWPNGRTALGVTVMLILFTVPGLLAIIFGFVGISTANRLRGKRKELAVLGVVLGFGWWAIWLMVYVLISAGAN